MNNGALELILVDIRNLLMVLLFFIALTGILKLYRCLINLWRDNIMPDPMPEPSNATITGESGETIQASPPLSNSSNSSESSNKNGEEQNYIPLVPLSANKPSTFAAAYGRQASVEVARKMECQRSVEKRGGVQLYDEAQV